MEHYTDWINDYKLQPHPEGGYFREIYSSPVKIKDSCLPEQFNQDRKLSTSIYFLLTKNDVSKFHRLKSDEIWYFHHGASVEIALISPDGNLKHSYLGSNLKYEEQFQVIIPAGCIFGARLRNDGDYAFMGCMVSPGFDFEDFEMPSRKKLLNEFPQYAETIISFTNP